jgi:hypothetical protein
VTGTQDIRPLFRPLFRRIRGKNMDLLWFVLQVVGVLLVYGLLGRTYLAEWSLCDRTASSS